MSLSSSSTANPDALMHGVSKSQSLSIHQQSSAVTISQETQQTLEVNNQQQQQHHHHQSPSQLQQNTTNNTNAQTSIPQEIATMSESDLISFINPNAFDQGKFLAHFLLKKF